MFFRQETPDRLANDRCAPLAATDNHLEALGPKLVEVLAALQVVVVGLYILGCRLLGLLLRVGRERHLQRLDDLLSDLVLDGEDVLQLPVIAISP